MINKLSILALALLLAACGESDSATPADEGTTVAMEVEAGEANPAGETEVEEARPSGDALSDMFLGDPDAPVTMIEYASLTCPHCASLHINVFPEIKKRYVDTGKVRYIFRHFILNQADFAASVLARCNGSSAFFDRLDFFFDRQRDWAAGQWQQELPIAARRVGISRANYDACFEQREIQEYILQTREEGLEKFEITGTPTLIIGGKKYSGPNSVDGIAGAIEDAL